MSFCGKIHLGRIGNERYFAHILAVKEYSYPPWTKLGDFMVNDNKAKIIAKYAIMFALILVSVIIDKTLTLGLIIRGATVELLVTCTVCFLFNTWLDGFLAFAFMGLSSFITSFWFANVVSQNPLVSVLPRLFVGIIAFASYRLIRLVTSKINKVYVAQTVSLTVSTLVALISNTVLYLGALTLFGDAYGSFADAIRAVTFLNIFPEYAVSLVCVSQVTLGVRRGLKIRLDGGITQDKQGEQLQ